MCGIVGYLGPKPALEILIPGLKRLEYRGYDSAGVALFREGKIEVKRSEGKLQNVEKLINEDRRQYLNVRAGIGHTRWATHGKPTTQNAHPHRVDHLVLVHNGIMENYQELKRELEASGLKPLSETDSEILGMLIFDQMKKGKNLTDACRAAFARVHGACSIVAMSEREPDVVVGVRSGSPLVVAQAADGGVIFASDAQPILEHTKEVCFMENGDIAVARDGKLEIFDLFTGKPVSRPTAKLDWSADKLDKQGYEHFMLKEIHEQPTALVDTLNAVLDRGSSDLFHFADQPARELLASAKRLVLIACGTSWHAALLGKYWIEGLGRVSVEVELASEYRYRTPVVEKGTVVLGISQSGETADTLAVIRSLKSQGVATAAITNVRGSTIAREAGAVIYTSAGPEIGVAATKTFSAQMMVLLLIAGFMARSRQTQPDTLLSPLFDGILRLPVMLKEDLEGQIPQTVRETAKEIVDSQGFFFMGRGLSYPLALEGALKLKEIAYVHAEGYAAGELKHGPIAMIDPGIAVVVLAPRDQWREKTISNLEEVKARGGKIIGVGEAQDDALKSLCDHWIPISSGPSRQIDEALLPFLVTPVIQLLSYEIALLKGTDVDKPRNLAKSVTVE